MVNGFNVSMCSRHPRVKPGIPTDDDAIPRPQGQRRWQRETKANQDHLADGRR